VHTGIPVFKADDGRDAGREAIATCHHVCGIAQREDAINGDACAQIVCFEPDFCIGGAVGKGFGGPTGVAFEAGEINGSANGRLDAGGIEVYRVLHTEGRPPGTVVAEGGDIGFIRLGASGRCPIETDVEPDDIARFPLRGVGGLDGTGGGEGGSGSVCRAGTDGDAQFPGGGRDGRRHWVVVGGAAPGQQDEEEYGGGGKEFMFHIVITF